MSDCSHSHSLQFSNSRSENRQICGQPASPHSPSAATSSAVTAKLPAADSDVSKVVGTVARAAAAAAAAATPSAKDLLSVRPAGSATPLRQKALAVPVMTRVQAVRGNLAPAVKIKYPYWRALLSQDTAEKLGFKPGHYTLLVEEGGVLQDQYPSHKVHLRSRTTQSGLCFRPDNEMCRTMALAGTMYHGVRLSASGDLIFVVGHDSQRVALEEKLVSDHKVIGNASFLLCVVQKYLLQYLPEFSVCFSVL